MPHALIRTSTSSGPATGCSTSTIPFVPGPVTMTAFIESFLSRATPDRCGLGAELLNRISAV